MERVMPTGDGVVRVDIDGRAETVYVAGPPDDRWAFWNGYVYRLKDTEGTEDTEKSVHRRARGTHILEVTSPMPALIVAIKVKEGDQVKNGDTLLIIEAMKMELPVIAPGDGRVKAIKCRVGELVPGDAVLVELE
jgi:biotin carboxyl carrier protein